MAKNINEIQQINHSYTQMQSQISIYTCFRDPEVQHSLGFSVCFWQVFGEEIPLSLFLSRLWRFMTSWSSWQQNTLERFKEIALTKTNNGIPPRLGWQTDYSSNLKQINRFQTKTVAKVAYESQNWFHRDFDVHFSSGTEYSIENVTFARAKSVYIFNHNGNHRPKQNAAAFYSNGYYTKRLVLIIVPTA